MAKKLKHVIIDTPKGKRSLTFAPITLDENTKSNIVGVACDKICPYGIKVCECLKDPMNPDDENRNFIDFCSNVGQFFVKDDDKDDTDTLENLTENYMPAEGTLEENLYDIDNFFEKAIKEKNLVKIGDVIDSVCPDACIFYNKEHSACTSTNEICMLHNLLNGRR